MNWFERLPQRKVCPRSRSSSGDFGAARTYLSLRGGAGGEFIYSDPGYTALIDSAVAVGGHAVAIALNSHMENDLAAIAGRVTERTRAVYLVNRTIRPESSARRIN